MLAEMPAGEFVEWGAYFDQEPWGDEVTNKQLAALCTLVAQFGGVKNAKPDDYLPQVIRPTHEATGAEVRAVCIGMARVFKKRGDG